MKCVWSKVKIVLVFPFNSLAPLVLLLAGLHLVQVLLSVTLLPFRVVGLRDQAVVDEDVPILLYVSIRHISSIEQHGLLD